MPDKDKEKDAPQEPSVPSEELAAIEAKANADADAAAAQAPAIETVSKTPEFTETAPRKEWKSQYDEAVAVIKSGRSVQIGPAVYSRIEDLPPASVLARGDVESQKRVLSDLKAQRDKILREIESLEKDIDKAEKAK